MRKWKCQTCLHEWLPTTEKLPPYCPSCRTTRWRNPDDPTAEPNIVSCLRCGKAWASKTEVPPTRCRFCASLYWNKPKRPKRYHIVIEKDEFSGAVKVLLPKQHKQVITPNDIKKAIRHAIEDISKGSVEVIQRDLADALDTLDL